MNEKNKKGKLPRGLDWRDDGKVLLICCPKCGRENYALNVYSGICTWCGYNANDDYAS